MTLIIPNTPPDPMEVYLVSVLRNQFPALSADAAASKALAIAKTIIAGMKKHGWHVIRSEDLLPVALENEFTDDSLAGAGITEDMAAALMAQKLAALLPEMALKYNMVSFAKETKPLTDPPMHVCKVTAIMFAPGSGAQRAAQAAADRQPALMATKVGAA